MAALTIHRSTGAPLIQLGSAGADIFSTVGVQGVARISMAIKHICLDGGAGTDGLDLSVFHGFGVTLDVAQSRMTFANNP